jgi:cell wall hydrolase
MFRRALVAIVTVGLMVPTLTASASTGTAYTQSSSTTSKLQKALKEKGFYRGAVDGVNGYDTQHAVMAFRKEIGAGRSYSWSSSLWDELELYQAPYSRYDEPDRVEVNLSKQVAHLWRGGKVVGSFDISSGGGYEYVVNGVTKMANTPTGNFHAYRHSSGWYESTLGLGLMLSPWFFTGGIALHGSNDVPSGPASHGCIRFTKNDSGFLDHNLFIGIAVHVYRTSQGPVYGSDGPFADVPASHQFVTEIQWMSDTGVTKGCRDYFFCPDDQVTRGQMAAFFHRFLGLPASASNWFGDDGGSLFQADINALADAGITKGCNPPANDRYCPDRKVSRGEMAAFIRRALDLPYVDQDFFTDDSASIFEKDLNAIAAVGIMKGCGTGTTSCPDNKVTREQMAAFLYRAKDLVS